MLISQTQAAEGTTKVVTTTEVGDATPKSVGTEHEAFYQGAEFWVALAFVFFFIIFGKKLGRAVGAILDDRSQKINAQLDEARNLREEAQEMLASYEKKQHEALKEAKDIVAAAKTEAERLTAEAAQQLKHNLKRSEQLATDRIHQAQAQAIAEVKDMAVDIATDAAKSILSNDMSATKSTALINDAIKGLDGKLN